MITKHGRGRLISPTPKRQIRRGHAHAPLSFAPAAFLYLPTARNYYRYSDVTRHDFHITHRITIIAHHVINVVRHVINFTRHVVSLTRHVVSLTRHVVSLTRHVVSLTRHVSNMARHMFVKVHTMHQKLHAHSCRKVENVLHDIVAVETATILGAAMELSI